MKKTWKEIEEEAENMNPERKAELMELGRQLRAKFVDGSTEPIDESLWKNKHKK